jgi:hypothetical protein
MPKEIKTNTFLNPTLMIQQIQSPPRPIPSPPPEIPPQPLPNPIPEPPLEPIPGPPPGTVPEPPILQPTVA